MTEWVLLVNVAAAWYMVGVIWFVQLVHYPQFARLPEGCFVEYHRHHTRFTTWVVGPAMLVELLTAVALPFVLPGGVPRMLGWVGLGLVVVLWASTIWVQVPRHNRLARGLDVACCESLSRGNWIRTLAWTARGVITLALLRLA